MNDEAAVLQLDQPGLPKRLKGPVDVHRRQAQALAQANLRGGGDGAPNERALSPLLPSESLSVGDAATETHRRLEALQAQQQQLLSSLRRDLARLPP